MAHAKMIDMAGHIMLGVATLTPTYRAATRYDRKIYEEG